MVEPVLEPRSHCADGATVHRDAGQPVYRDAPGHICDSSREKGRVGCHIVKFTFSAF